MRNAPKNKIEIFFAPVINAFVVIVSKVLEFLFGWIIKKYPDQSDRKEDDLIDWLMRGGG